MAFGESPQQALQREIMEETGLEVETDRILFASTWPTTPKREALVICYLCISPSAEVRLSCEHQDYFWADKNQAHGMLSGNTLHDWEQYNLADIPELTGTP